MSKHMPVHMFLRMSVCMATPMSVHVSDSTTVALDYALSIHGYKCA